MGNKNTIPADMERQAFKLISDAKVLKEGAAIANSGGTREDISAALHMPMDVVARLFAIYDVNNNNQMDAGEVLTFVRDLNNGTNFIACYQCNEIIAKSCYACQTCNWEYKLCGKCHQHEEHKHPHKLTFLQEPVSTVFASKLKGMPKELGLLKAIEIQRLFEDVDKNGDGRLTLVELSSSQAFKRLVPGLDTTQCQQLMRQFDTDHNLSLDPVEFATCIAITLGTVKCSECSKMVLKDMASALTCCKKDHEYYICRGCYNLGKVAHNCPYLEKLGMLHLSGFGLTVTPKGNSTFDCYLEVTNRTLWKKWRPFFEGIIKDDRSIYLNPKYHASQDLEGMQIGVLDSEIYFIQTVHKEFDNKPVKLVELVCTFMGLHQT
eukprot:TRINITY_DN1223_c0_g1_i2.p2 TRINITY_DN1223_c0_g1~~TRINITY_DN1223_c0_g1_i2.p2  ORF type:complete len:378 (+),score=26.51 TRINITY_DN1223_c0_g1_i2:162-1295(+)